MPLKIPAALILASAVLAMPAVARLRPVPVAIPDGKPVNCLNLPLRQTVVRDDRTIDFFTNGRRVYRNVLPYSCPSLGIERAFAFSTSQTQLCSVDIITVLRQGGGGPRTGASCGLGQFQPVTGVKP